MVNVNFSPMVTNVEHTYKHMDDTNIKMKYYAIYRDVRYLLNLLISLKVGDIKILDLHNYRTIGES